MYANNYENLLKFNYTMRNNMETFLSFHNVSPEQRRPLSTRNLFNVAYLKNEAEENFIFIDRLLRNSSA